jgi:SAM-dependent methyltransferase
MTTKDELIKFYSNRSKHSNYQALPRSLKKLIGESEVQTKSRYEKERLRYILGHVYIKGKTVLDIGANTGFFSFELLDAGADRVTCYEGNKEHAEFLKLASKAIGRQDEVQVHDEYYLFDNKDKYDVTLLLNILHHFGDDYGDQSAGKEKALAEMLKQLNELSLVSGTVVFQLGFNWHGDPAKPLFQNGTKKEVINFIEGGIKDSFDVSSIGVAVKRGGNVEYEELSDSNIERDDSLGEFLNRPIFILKSKR